MTAHVRTRGDTSTRRTPGRRRQLGSLTRGRRSKARLGGRAYQTALVQPRHVELGLTVWERFHVHAHVVAGALLSAILLSVICLLFSSSRFFVWDVEIVGARWIRPETAIRASEMEGMNIFWIDPAAVKGRLQSLPSVRRAEVFLRLPNQLAVHIVERTPVAVWQAGNVQHWVDEEGVLFTRAMELPNPVVIVEQEAPAHEIGERVPVEVVRTALDINAHLPEAQLFGYSPGEGLVFQRGMAHQVQVQVGCNADRIVASLHAVEMELNRQGIRPRIIDLRSETRAFWR